MTMHWYVRIQGQEHGPLLPSQLKKYADSGKITRDTEVRRKVDDRWVSAQRVRGLFPTDEESSDTSPLSDDDVLAILDASSSSDSSSHPNKCEQESHSPSCSESTSSGLGRRSLLEIAESMASGSEPDIPEIVVVENRQAQPKAGTESVLEAAKEGDLEVLKVLIHSNHALANVSDDKGRGPLFLAVAFGHYDVAEYLLSHGADVNAQTAAGYTPLYIATMGGMLGAAELIKHAGVEERVRHAGFGESSKAFLDNAIAEMKGCQTRPVSSAQMVNLLLTHGADVNLPEVAGRTPLHMAAGLGDPKVVQLLLTHGANTSICTRDWKTPLDFCSDIVLMDLLVSHGTQPGPKHLGKVATVASMMILQGGLECLFAGVYLTAIPFAVYTDPDAPPWITMLLVGTFTAMLGILRIVAGRQNRKWQGRKFGVLVLSIGFLSFITACCAPTGIALGIYGLTVYLNRDVVLVFDRVEKYGVIEYRWPLKTSLHSITQ